jgi:uncharacterized protein YndB with AHSA1/START domain
MTENELLSSTRAIVVEDVFPYPRQAMWKVLTSGELMGRWMMKPNGFLPERGNRFTFQTTPAGAWDGTIRCEVLDIVPFERFSFSWKGGDAGNTGYGSKLETIVTWTLSDSAGGTRLTLRHSGFEAPRNDVAYENMGKGWRICLERVSGIAGEQTV